MPPARPLAPNRPSRTPVLPLFLALGALALGASPAPAETLPLTLMPVEKVSVSDTSPDAAAPVLSHAVLAPVARFDASGGVLLGVAAQLAIEPGQGLMAYRNESGGSWDSVATLRTQLWLGPGLLAQSGASGLLRVTANRDAPVVIDTRFATLDYGTQAAAALDAFVGSGVLNLSLNTSLSALISGGGGGSTAIASLLAVDAQGQGSPDVDGFTGQLQWQYQSLGHAQLSFAAGMAQPTTRLTLAGGDRLAVPLFALADTARTGADLLRVDCSGDCGAFSLDLAGFQALAAGQSVGAALQSLGSAPASATYTLWVADTAGIGAAASHRQHSLVLQAQVSAVPEPAAPLLMALGLSALALARRRRKA